MSALLQEIRQTIEKHLDDLKQYFEKKLHLYTCIRNSKRGITLESLDGPYS